MGLYLESPCLAMDSVKQEWVRVADEWGFLPFYEEKNPETGWLVNFYPARVEYKGLIYLNSEAAFQAQKFTAHPEIMAEFTQFPPLEAFKRARELAHLVPACWREVNVQVMKEVLLAKVAQNPEIGEWLDATGHRLIVEHTPVKGRDAFWADDHDGTGKNMLGKIWMEIRAERRNEPVDPADPSHPAWQSYLRFLEEELCLLPQ